MNLNPRHFRTLMFYIILMFYDDDNYTKAVHDAVLAKEEAERLQKWIATP